MPLEELSTLRKEPGSLTGRRIAPSLLKHADEQTVLGVAAVLRTIAGAGWQDRDFSEWGVIAAPRFPGRLSLAPAMAKFQRRGAAGVSPLIVPNLSLHAMAGAISLALGAHGFNLGVGGGHGHLAEALLCALAGQADCDLPGLWVVATEWDPEPIPDEAGGSQVPTVGAAVVLALGPVGATARLGLRIVPAAPRPMESAEDEPESGLRGLAEFLAGVGNAARVRRWSCPLTGGGMVVLDHDPERSARLSGAS